jgi:hypothetical protein
MKQAHSCLSPGRPLIEIVWHRPVLGWTSVDAAEIVDAVMYLKRNVLTTREVPYVLAGTFRCLWHERPMRVVGRCWTVISSTRLRSMLRWALLMNQVTVYPVHSLEIAIKVRFDP